MDAKLLFNGERWYKTRARWSDQIDSWQYIFAKDQAEAVSCIKTPDHDETFRGIDIIPVASPPKDWLLKRVAEVKQDIVDNHKYLAYLEVLLSRQFRRVKSGGSLKK